jgi:hypothetical protein
MSLRYKLSEMLKKEFISKEEINMYGLFDVTKGRKNLHKPLHTKKFILPLQGLILDTKDSISLGNVILYSKESINEEYDLNGIDQLVVSTFAYIDTERIGEETNYRLGENSIAFRIVKEIVGYLYILVFKKYKLRKERKIMISNNREYEMNEGFAPYWAGDSYFKNINFSLPIDLKLNISEVDSYLNNARWEKILDKKPKERTNLQKKIVKSLEVLYTIYNEINANERISKYFILLNYLLKESPEQNINRKFMSRYLNEIICNRLGLDVFDSKFTKAFDKFYHRLRNCHEHGVLKENEELTLIDENDYNNLTIIVMNLIIYLAEHEDTENCSSIKDLYKKFKDDWDRRKKEN